jgi:hypothetical protein
VRFAELAPAGRVVSVQSSELGALDVEEGLVALRARHLDPGVGFGERGLDCFPRLEALGLTEYAGSGEQSRELPESVAAREKIAGRMLLLDETLADGLPLMFDFLGVPDPERPLRRSVPRRGSGSFST